MNYIVVNKLCLEALQRGQTGSSAQYCMEAAHSGRWCVACTHVRAHWLWNSTTGTLREMVSGQPH